MTERAALAGLSGLALLSVAALVLVRLGAFAAAPVAAAGLFGVAAGWALFRSPASGGGSPEIPAGEALLALLVAGIPLAVALHVGAEPLLGQTDAGVYVATGVHLARTGSLLVRPEALEEAPAWTREAFLVRERPRVGQFEGPEVDNVDPGFTLSGDGRVVHPQFLPLFPAWLALAASAGGTGGALLLPALVSVPGLWLFWAAARRTVGRRESFAALLVVAASPLELWYAREPLAAMPTQALVMATLFVLVSWESAPDPGRRRRLELLAGLLAGLALHTKLTALLLLPGLALWSLGRRAVVLPLSLAAGAASAFALGLWATPEYLRASAFQAWYLVPALLRTPGRLASALVLAAVATTLATALLERLDPPRSRALLRTALVSYATWLLLLRAPVPFEVTRHSEDTTNILQLAWYTTGLLPALALLGALGAVAGPPALRALLLVTVWDPLLLLVNNAAPNIHPWMLKRYVVVALPLIALLASAALGALARNGLPGRILAVALTAFLVLVPHARHPAMAHHPALRGVRSLLDQLAAAIPAGSFVVVEGGARSLAMPLWLVEGRPTAVLARADLASRHAAREAMRAWQARGRDVYVLSDAPGGLGGVAPTVLPLSLATLRQMKDAPAGEIEEHRARLYLSAVPPLPPLPARIEVGGVDFGLVSGVYYPERTADGRTYRWSGPELDARIRRDGDALCMTLAGFRPEAASPASLTVTANGTLLAAGIPCGQGFQEIALPLPPSIGGELEVEVRITPFVPALTSATDDLRELGVMVSEIRAD